MELSGKVALITGGSKGIGGSTAIALARRGADVAIVARNRGDQAERTLAEIQQAGRRGEFIQADMGVPEQSAGCVEKALAKFGRVDVLVHSAGGPILGTITEVQPEEWYRGFEVHVHAAFHLCRAAIPGMKERQEGAIVFVSSIAGRRGVKTAIGYQTVKGALPQMTRGLAFELSDWNIRVNCVAPGIIRTDFHKQMPAEMRKHNLDNRIPLHREGTPEQVAQTILELVTNDYITGETVTVDGGLTMRIA